MGEIHELLVLALSLVWFAGATPEKGSQRSNTGGGGVGKALRRSNSLSCSVFSAAIRNQAKGVLAKGVSAESSVTPKEAEYNQGYWAQQYIWHSERHRPREVYILHKPPSNLDRRFQSRNVSIYGALLVLQRRARSKISIHERSLEIFIPAGRDQIFSIPGPSGIWGGGA